MILAGALLVGSILWSVVFETLLPLAQAGHWQELTANLVGIPVIFAGTAAMIWGCLLFVLATFEGMASGERAALSEMERKGIRGAERRAAQRAMLERFLVVWRPGILWLAGGFMVILAGGWWINR